VDDDRMDAGMGGSFWLKVFGLLILGGIAAMLVFLLFEAVWVRSSLLGAVALFIVVLLGIAYIGDRRSQRRYDEEIA
jgi:membrane protein YdbS with pleckstrin-like domain